MIAVVAILASECMFVAMKACYKYAEREKAREADAREKGWYRTVGYIKEVLLEPGQHLSLLVGRSHLKHQLFEGYECKLCWENKVKVYITPSEEVYCERYVAVNKELVTKLMLDTQMHLCNEVSRPSRATTVLYVR